MRPQRVQKLIANYGYCSRRKAEELIEAGRVTVNGTVVTIGANCMPTDTIAVDGKKLEMCDKLYLMFHKPTGCVTALHDPKYKTIYFYITLVERVIPIGRLDFNTSGLLLLTNDGDFANSIMHPRYEVKKTYAVTIHKPITDRDLRTIEHGVLLEDGKTLPAKVVKKSPTQLEVTLHEGKNRIVRRMFMTLGYSVRELKRIQIGSLTLGGLKPGEWKHLPHEPGKWPKV